MNFLSLYSGVGMHDLGFTRAGISIVGQVEWDEYCCAVLEKHWPNLPRWKDVRHVTVESVRERCGRIDGITGGFSCKDISVAGAGRGIAKDTESGITWRNMFRLIRGLLPRWLVIENVPRLRTLAADRVLAALERIGYACWPVVVGAEHVGAPHRRHRVWIVGHAARGRRQQRTGIEASAGMRSTPRAIGNTSIVPDAASVRWPGEGNRREETGQPHDVLSRISPGGCWRCADFVANTGSTGLEIGRARTSGAGASLSIPSGSSGNRWPARPNEQQHEWEHPRLSNANGEPLGGITEPWEERGEGSAQSGLGGTASRRAGRLAGFARRHALKALGNGNPPACAEAIGRVVLHLDALLRAETSVA